MSDINIKSSGAYTLESGRFGIGVEGVMVVLNNKNKNKKYAVSNHCRRHCQQYQPQHFNYYRQHEPHQQQ